MYNEEFGARLRLFRESLSPKVSRDAMGDALGVSRDVINNLERGRVAKIPQSMVKLICHTYPQLNPVWLETGAGQMLIDATPGTLEELVDEKLPTASPLVKAMLMMILTRPDDELQVIEKALIDLHTIYESLANE